MTYLVNRLRYYIGRMKRLGQRSANVDSYRKQIADLLKVPENTLTLRHSKPNSFGTRGQQGSFELCIPGAKIATFHILEMPGCCGIAISTQTVVAHAYRRKGLGTLLNRFRQDIAWHWGYTVMICSDKEPNAPQEKILPRTGWIKRDTFKNRRSGHKVSIHTLHLKKATTPLAFEVPSIVPAGSLYDID